MEEKGQVNKSTIEGEKWGWTIHLKKLIFGRRARWANEGFSGKPIRHLGFGSETICPSLGISDSAVKLSALVEELEKPFRVLIGSDWYCDSRKFIGGELHLQTWERDHVRFLQCVSCGWTLGLQRVYLIGYFYWVEFLMAEVDLLEESELKWLLNELDSVILPRSGRVIE